MTYLPRALAVPPRRAFPYPFSFTRTTRAPIRAAISDEPSVLPLSATMISPAIRCSQSTRRTFSMHSGRVSASLRQGITTDNSTGQVSDARVVFELAVAIFSTPKYWRGLIRPRSLDEQGAKRTARRTLSKRVDEKKFIISRQGLQPSL